MSKAQHWHTHSNDLGAILHETSSRRGKVARYHCHVESIQDGHALILMVTTSGSQHELRMPDNMVSCNGHNDRVMTPNTCVQPTNIGGIPPCTGDKYA